MVFPARIILILINLNRFAKQTLTKGRQSITLAVEVNRDMTKRFFNYGGVVNFNTPVTFKRGMAPKAAAMVFNRRRDARRKVGMR